MAVFLFFLYLFAFPIGKLPFVDSSWIAFVILVLCLIANSRYRETVSKLFKHRIIYKIAGIIVLISIYCAIVTTLSNAYDYHFIITLIHQFIAAFIGIFVAAYAIHKNKNIIEAIVLSFTWQGLIQLVSMIFPQFRDATNVFRPESAIIRGQWTYTGIRGLAISGSAFFGLSVAYGLVFILYALNRDRIFLNTPLIIKTIMFIVLIFGGISAGRTSLIGLFFALLIILYKTLSKRKIYGKKKNAIMTIAGFVILVIAFQYIDRFSLLELDVFRYFRNYTTEFLSGHTTSGDSLRNMYFPIKLKTFLFGDGLYGTASSYYMNTDAGYMRVLLYVGLPGIILMLWLQNQYLTSRNKITILGFLLVMQIKGEVIGFSIGVESILLLYYFYQIYQYDEEGYKL